MSVELSDRPVFLLGCAWRSGSTLLQRALSTHPELHIWGENHGAVSALADAAHRLQRQRNAIRKSADAYAARGLDGFIANLNPPLAEAGGPAARAWLLAYYREASEALGKPRWGFKDVRYDAAVARFLLSAFPAGRVLFLVRDPVSVLASMATIHWSAGGPRAVIARWSDNTRSFRGWSDPRAMTVRYETLIASSRTEMARIAGHLGLNGADFDLGVFDKVVRGSKSRPGVGLAEVAALLLPAARRATVAAGYTDPLVDPRLALVGALKTSARALLARRRT